MDLLVLPFSAYSHEVERNSADLIMRQIVVGRLSPRKIASNARYIAIPHKSMVPGIGTVYRGCSLCASGVSVHAGQNPRNFSELHKRNQEIIRFMRRDVALAV